MAGTDCDELLCQQQLRTVDEEGIRNPGNVVKANNLQNWWLNNYKLTKSKVVFASQLPFKILKNEQCQLPTAVMLMYYRY